MSRFFIVLALGIAGVVAVGQQTSQQGQPSLADIARKSRTQQKPSAVARYDEESFRNSAPSAPDQTEQPSDDQKVGEKKPDDKAADAKAKEQKPKEDVKGKIEAQKNEISMLQREIDVAQREQRLRAAAFYGDAGTQMRDQAKFAEETRKQQETLDSKKQALDAAQQKLADLEEQARRAGARTE